MGKKSTASGGSLPQINPQQLMQLQRQNNQISTSGPFGSQTYGTDAQGNRTYNTTLTPQMQGAVDLTFQRAMRESPRYQRPEGLDALLARYMQRGMGSRRLARDPLPTKKQVNP